MERGHEADDSALDSSRTLRPFLEEVWMARDSLVHDVARQVAQLPTYAASPASEVWVGMTRILRRSVEGDPFALPTDADREAAIATGAQGGRAGIAVDDLVAAVLLGSHLVEEEVLQRAAAAGVAADVRLEGSARVRRWSEQITVWAVQGLASATGTETADTRHRRLIEAIQRRDAVPELCELLTDAGLDAGQPLLVVCATPDGSPGSDVGPSALRFSHRGRAAWAEHPDGDIIGVLSEEPSAVPGLVVGLARASTPDELDHALRESRRVARAAASLRGAGVHTAGSLGLLLTLHEDPLLRERLVNRWIDPLRTDPRQDLVSTLRAWQEHRGQIEAASRELGVHPNTVRNRLRTLDLLWGPQWRDMGAQAEIWAALVAEGATPVPSG